MTWFLLPLIIGLCIGLGIWKRRRGWAAYITAASPESVAQTALAHQAFAQGNLCLAANQFPEAIASFQQALAIAPQHPHAHGRIAVAEQQQLAAHAQVTS